MLVILKAKSSDYPIEPTDKWRKLSDKEKYSLFRSLTIEYDALLIQYNRLTAVSDSQKKRIDLLLREIKRLQSNEFKYGVSWGLSAGLDNKLNIDIEIQSQFYIIFLKRFFVSPAFSVKFYQNIGGSLYFAFGFLW